MKRFLVILLLFVYLLFDISARQLAHLRQVELEDRINSLEWELFKQELGP